MLTADQLSRMTEADVRAEIIDPIVARLGYRFGADNYVFREGTLKYPYVRIGRRSKNDVRLTGAPDYFCGITGRRGRFVIEAKKPNREISLADIEQAHSYAVHPEVQAHFFVLANGRTLEIYESLAGPTQQPVVRLSYDELEREFYKIEQLLSPARLTTICHREYDVGLPVAAGFGSRARVLGGTQGVSTCELHLVGGTEEARANLTAAGFGAQMSAELNQQIGFEYPIVSGICERGAGGNIFARVEFGSVHVSLSKMLDLLGIRFLEFHTDAGSISADSEQPTLFETHKVTEVRRGDEIFKFLSTVPVISQFDLSADFFAQANGHIANDKFKGEWAAIAMLSIPALKPLGLPDFVVTQIGPFEIRLE